MAQEVLVPLVGVVPRLRKIWADMGYIKNELTDWVKTNLNSELTILKHPWQGEQRVWVPKGKNPPPAIEKPKGFVVLKWRWVVERTFGWFEHSRRLSRSYEVKPEHEEGFIYITMTRIMLRRLVKVD